MPYDETGFQTRRERGSLREAVLDLMASAGSRAPQDDPAYRAALAGIVARSRDRADDLWLKYRGERADARALAFARYSS